MPGEVFEELFQVIWFDEFDFFDGDAFLGVDGVGIAFSVDVECIPDAEKRDFQLLFFDYYGVVKSFYMNAGISFNRGGGDGVTEYEGIRVSELRMTDEESFEAFCGGTGDK